MARTARIFRLVALALLGLLLSGTVSTPATAQRGEPVAPVDLSEAERSWIAAHREVLVGFTKSFPPYSQWKPAGKMEGIDLDYLDLIARRTGLVFKPVIFADWSRAEEALKNGQVDLLTGLVHTAQREAYVLFTQSYIYAPDVVVTRTDTPYVLDAKELRGLTIGKVRGYSFDAWAQTDGQNDFRVVEFNDIQAVFHALSRGTIDATLTDTVNAAYTIKSMHLTNLRLGSVIGGPGATYLGVSRQKPELKAIIDRALDTITTKDRRTIDERWVAVDLAPSKWQLAFKWAAGLALGALVIFTLSFVHSRRLTVELNERRRIQNQLETTLMKLARVSEEKSELMRMVAHDLRSPLTSLGLSVELLALERAALSASNQELLPRMLDTVRQMRGMTDDLVEAHQLEEGLLQFELTTVDLSALVREVVAAWTGRAEQKRIRLEIETAEPAIMLLSNRRALHRVADNLISNALKYSPPGSEVRVELLATDAGCRLLVSDQGPGVKTEEGELIFEKYGRGSALPTAGEKSTGLGLWIVRHIVQALQGRVWQEPARGPTGSVFIVEFGRPLPAA